MIRIIFISVLLFYCNASFAQSHDLILQIDNIEVKKGKIMLAVFDNENDFKTKENPVFTNSIIVTDSILKTVFKSIPQGNYAMAIYHDENSDGKLNTAKLGIPTEGVGFSGIATTHLKKPKFKDCVFEINCDTTITINMFYKKKKDLYKN